MLSERCCLGDNIEVVPRGKLRKIPVLSLVNAGSFNTNEILNYCQSNECIETDIPGKNIFALRITCDSMEPEFYPNDLIIVDPDREAKTDDFVVVKSYEHETTVKQLKKYGHSWVLHPLNPKYKDIVLKKGEFQVVGVVIKKEKKYY